MATEGADRIASIRAEFDRDLEEMPPALNLDDVPAFYECITPQWLTAVVRRRHPDATVTGVRLGERDSGTTNRRRTFLEYAEADRNKGYPASVFCKAAQDLPNRITMSAGSAEGEVRFYNEIRPRLPIDAPEAYFAAIAYPSYRAIIVLKDISAEAEFCGYQTPMSRKRAESQIELLARMHGAFYDSAELWTGPLARIEPFPRRFHHFVSHHGLEKACHNGLVAAAPVMPASLLARRAEVWPATLRAVESLLEGPQTLCHGDVHLGNWYVRPDERMGLTDFQNVTTGHWARDLAYTISTALTVEDRRRWERDLVALYLERLAQAGGGKEGFDETWKRYRQQMLAAMAWWTVTLTPSPTMAQDMQTKETTLCFLERIGAAVEDLETLDSFD
jgi:hypothetical protein